MSACRWRSTLSREEKNRIFSEGATEQIFGWDRSHGLCYLLRITWASCYLLRLTWARLHHRYKKSFQKVCEKGWGKAARANTTSTSPEMTVKDKATQLYRVNSKESRRPCSGIRRFVREHLYWQEVKGHYWLVWTKGHINKFKKHRQLHTDYTLNVSK